MTEKVWIFILLGMVLGNIIGFPLADRLSKRWTLQHTTVYFLIMTVIGIILVVFDMVVGGG